MRYQETMFRMSSQLDWFFHVYTIPCLHDASQKYIGNGLLFKQQKKSLKMSVSVINAIIKPKLYVPFLLILRDKPNASSLSVIVVIVEPRAKPRLLSSGSILR